VDLYILRRQTSGYVGERQREHGERVITVGRPVRDAELEMKSVSRSEKSERPRSSESSLMQNIPVVFSRSSLISVINVQCHDALTL